MFSLLNLPIKSWLESTDGERQPDVALANLYILVKPAGGYSFGSCFLGITLAHDIRPNPAAHPDHNMTCGERAAGLTGRPSSCGRVVTPMA